MTLPNIITIARIFMVPLIVWMLVDGLHCLAFWMFLIAGVSDAVDGIIARRFNLQSNLGAHLDPIADKALLVSIYVTLGMMLEIPTWIVIAVVSRDILIVGGVLLSWMLDQPIAMKPLAISKANTAAQIVFAGIVLADLGLPIELGLLRWGLGYLVVATTIGSATAYLFAWLSHMGDYEVHSKD